jgi:hypothetical protein
VIRQRDGKQHACAVNVRKSFANAVSDAFVLQPLDIVYVPRTTIDRVDQWVDQYINQIIPRNLHATFSVNREIVNSNTQTEQSPIQIQIP